MDLHRRMDGDLFTIVHRPRSPAVKTSQPQNRRRNDGKNSYGSSQKTIADLSTRKYAAASNSAEYCMAARQLTGLRCRGILVGKRSRV
jgi:hypothetical protein